MDDSLSIRKIAEGIAPADEGFRQRARERTARLLMPERALGRLHSIAEALCAIQSTLEPDVSERTVLVFAGDHGVAAEGVSAYPQELSAEMIRCFATGGAAINAMCRQAGAGVLVTDMGVVADVDPAEWGAEDRVAVRKVGRGTASITRGPAMSAEQAEECVNKGFSAASEAIRRGSRLIAPGDMGIGNTTASAAVGSAVTGADPARMTGPGTGVGAEGLERKRRAVEQALRVNGPDPVDGLDVLAKVGGFEIGGIAGCVLAGAHHRVPVVLDGFISTAGALIAALIAPDSRGYMFAGHRSEEPGHRIMLQYLGLAPILELDMRLGEGTGAALAMNVIDAAARMFKEVWTFEQAGLA
jgi:nicotinate-nucleotide--dimethylbenzimidazole phosphoribosyltransferase